MYSWTKTLHLNAPREKVWNTLVDFANLSAWDPRVDRSTVETTDPIGQGTRIRVEKGSSKTLLTVEEWGPPRLLRLHIARGSTSGSTRFYLTNAPEGGTTLEHTFELDPPLLLEPLMLFVGFGVSKEMAALKRWVEKGQSG